MIGPRFKFVEQPIFCLCVLKDYVLIASGGGGARYGVRNKILSYKIIDDHKFSEDALHTAEFEKEIPVFIHSLALYDLFCTAIDNFTVFYHLDINNGSFREIARLQVIDFYDPDIYQTVCVFDATGKYFASGTTDGTLK